MCLGVGFFTLIAGTVIVLLGRYAPGLFSSGDETRAAQRAAREEARHSELAAGRPTPAPAPTLPAAPAPESAPAPQPAPEPAAPRGPLADLPLERVVSLLSAPDPAIQQQARERLLDAGPGAIEALLDRQRATAGDVRRLRAEVEQLRKALEAALAQAADERQRREDAQNQHGAARVGELYRQATEATQRAEHGRTRILCDAVLGLQPDHVGARALRARAALAVGAFADAREDFEAATRLDPTYGPHHRGLGQALLGLRDWDAATAAFARALELDAGDADAIAGRERATGEQRAAEATKDPDGGGR